MGKQKKGKGAGGSRNADRRNGKAAKQNPGLPGGAATGKTKGGYSPAKQAQRAAARRG